MDHPLLVHCTIEESTGRFKIGNGSFSISGNSPNATCAIGQWNDDKQRFDRVDRMTGCSIQDLSGGVQVVSGIQRSAIVKVGASPAEARMTLRITPGVTHLQVEEEVPSL